MRILACVNYSQKHLIFHRYMKRMYMKRLLIVSFLLMNLSSAAHDNADDPRRFTDSLKSSGMESPPDTLQNDEFIFRILERDLTLNALDSIYQPRHPLYKRVPNKHDPDKNDTIISYHAGNDSIRFHKAFGKAFPIGITIRSSRVTLDTSIKVGMAKRIFMEKFNLTKLSDTAVITNTEEGDEVIFTFIDEHLVKIVYKCRYLD
jgi:hypothetical protein